MRALGSSAFPLPPNVGTRPTENFTLATGFDEETLWVGRFLRQLKFLALLKFLKGHFSLTSFLFKAQKSLPTFFFVMIHSEF